MISEHQKIINRQVKLPEPTKVKFSLPETMMIDDVIVPIKPRDRYLAKKLMN